MLIKELKPWLIITTVFYLFFLFWNLPSDRVLSFMTERNLVPGKLLLTSSPQGSWHNGQLTGVQFGGIEIPELHWQLQPVHLLLGRLQFIMDCDLPGGESSWTLQLTPSTLTIKQLQGKIPAAILGRTLPGFILTGSLQAENISLTIQDGLLKNATGRASWSEAGLGSPYNMNIGGLLLDLETDLTGIGARISDTGGPLQATIIGRLVQDGNYTFDGAISARQGSPADLATFLQLFGRPGSDGLIRVSFNGHLPRLK
jgi:hypothetical protein